MLLNRLGRRCASFAVVGVLLAFSARTTLAQGGPDEPASPLLIAVDVPQNEVLRHKAITAFRALASDAEMIVGHADEDEIAILGGFGLNVHRLGTPMEDEDLVIVPVLGPDVAAGLTELGDVLHRRGMSALVRLRQGVDHHDLEDVVTRGGTKFFHCGIQHVGTAPLRPVIAPRYSPSGTPDSRITGLVDQILAQNLQDYVDTLSNDFTTRRSDTQGGFDARDYLVAEFNSFGGLLVSTHSFDSGSDNVIAELTGETHPERLVIFGAHFDSINYNGSRAPGADDNASGTAGVLEVARILANSGLRFANTIRFMTFAAEEFGLVGSAAYASQLANQGADVVAMINTDMNAYRASGDSRSVDLVTNNTTAWLNDYIETTFNVYVPSLPVQRGVLSAGTSDHASFYANGFPAAFPFEDINQYSPHIHTGNDTLGTSANDFNLSEDIVRGLLASVALLAEPLDLQIVHSPLTDQTSSSGPYVVRANVTSLISTQVVDVRLAYDIGSGFVESTMLPSGNADEWISQIPGVDAGTVVRYYIYAEDDQGYSEWLPPGPNAGTSTFEYTVGDVQTIFQDSFESSSGWTHGGSGQDDWQRGIPQGKSTDPSSAHDGLRVWGNDLGPSGWNGEYSSNVSNWLQSPSIDCSSNQGIWLRYRRFLGVEDGIYDQARLRVGGSVVWQNASGSGSDHHIDTSWALHTLDVSSVADGNPDVRIRFELQSDGGLGFGGWNVDDLSLFTLSEVHDELAADTAYVSLAQGDDVALNLELGSVQAGRSYLILASVSGSEPGIDINGVPVPINFDPVTALFLNLVPLLPGWSGNLDGTGSAMATLPIQAGLDPGFVGTQLTLAAITTGPIDHATNPINVLFIP